MITFKKFANNTKDGGFEEACKYLLENLGYTNCIITPDNGGDDGIDIIAEKDNIKYGFQCKNYETKKVSVEKIRDFKGALEKALPIEGITNGIFMTTSTFTSKAIQTAKELGIDIWDYTKIKNESTKLGFNLETLELTEEKPIETVVFPHNKEAYNKMDEMLTNKGKCILVMGTGVGKTTTALEYCIQHGCRALVVGPSIVVLDGWKNNKANSNDLIDTLTYQSFAKSYQSIKYAENYGLVIFDEVHHGGADIWGAGIKYLIDSNIKVLGLTATEVRTDGIDVSDVLFDGCCVEGLSLIEGIKAGVIYPFTYVGAFYDASNVCQAAKDKYGDKLTEMLLGKLDTVLNNTEDVRDIVKSNMPKGDRKGIIFSADIDSMDADIKLIKDIYPDAEIKKLHSNMTNNAQDAAKKWFSNTKSGYLCNVNMVNEGAHYPGVNTIFMLRKTESELTFLQQLGRVITGTYNNEEDPKAIVFDLVNSSKAVQAVKKTFMQTNVSANIMPIDISEEDYSKLLEAINEELINPMEIEDEESDDTIIELSEEDIETLKNDMGLDINVDDTEESEHVPQLSRTIYLKKDPTYNTDYGKSKQIIVNDYTEDIVKVLEEVRDRCGQKDWTEEEDNIIREYYPEEGSDMYIRLNNRTRQACQRRAYILDITHDNSWSEEEDDILREYYPTEGSKVCERLPGRTRNACVNRARIVDIKSNPCIKQKKVLCIELNKTFNSILDAEKELKVVSTSIGKCCNGKRKTAGGYHWKYIEEDT